jgi:hypothetical protein
MSASAIILGCAGILLTFLPEETTQLAGWSSESKIVLQIAGALYFGFAMTNWMSKANLIGGIYNRPIAIGNAIHFFVGTMALLKFSPKSSFLLTATVLYSVFAILFGYILFTHPIKDSKTE